MVGFGVRDLESEEQYDTNPNFMYYYKGRPSTFP